MFKRIIHLVVLMTTSAAVINCQSGLDISKMNEKVLHFQLENGMTIVLKEDHSNPVTAMHLRVKTGSIHEKGYYGSGLSHFFEHSLFLGSKNHPVKDSYSAEIESYGGANVNAYTTFDHTAYHFTVLSKYTDPAIRALEDLVFHPLFPEKDVENEMGSILSEMDMGDDNPDRYFSKFTFRTMFDKLPYKYPVIGYNELFSKLDVEELLAYYKRTYIPNNMILSLTGDFDVKKLLPVIEEVFGQHEAKELPELIFEEEDAWQKKRAEISHPKAGYPRLAIAWQTVSQYEEDMYPLDVLSSMLGSGMGSLLYQKLKDEKKLVENVGCFSWTPKYNGVFEVSFDLPVIEEKEKIRKRVKLLERETLSLLNEIKEGKIDDYRINTVKRGVLSSFFHGKEMALAQAQSLAGSVMATGDSIHYDQTYLKGIEKVTKQDIVRVAKKYFSDDNFISMLMVSSTIHKDGFIFPDTITDDLNMEITYKEEKDTRRVPGVQSSLKQLDEVKSNLKITSDTLNEENKLHRKKYQNGLTLLHRKVSRLPKISLSVVAQGGLLAETGDVVNGSFELLSSMFLTGNESYTKDELIKELKLHGIGLEPFSGKYSFGFKMTFLNDRLKVAKELFATIMNQQTLHSEDFEQEKQDQLFAIKRSEEDGWSVSGRYFKQLFFTDTPLEKSAQGSVASVESIKKEDLETLKKKMLSPEYMVVSVYGDISSHQAEDLVSFITQKKKGDVALPSPANIHHLEYAGPKEVYKNTQAGSKQSYFRLAYQGPSMGDQDMPAFKVLSGYLSGMGGPLFKLRSEPFGDVGGGRAYQLGTFYDDSRDYGAIVFYAGLRYEARNEYPWAVKSFQDELKPLIDRPLSDSELHRARLSILGRDVIQNQLVGSLAFNEAIYELYGFQAENYLSLRDKISEVSAKDVQKVAKKYLDTDKFIVHVLLPEE